MTKYARNYRLRCVGKFWTMFHKDNRGEDIASIILPAWCEPKDSLTRCNVDKVTGVPTGTNGTLRCVKPSTILEIQDPRYRDCANSNAERIREMSFIPGVPFSFSEYLDEWVDEADCRLLRVFFGGDGCISGGLNAMLSIAYCARRNPDKLFYTRTGNLDALEYVYKVATDEGLEFPKNMLVCYECQLGRQAAEARLAACGSASPIVTFSVKEGVDDMSNYPELDEDFVIRIPENCIIK